MSRRTPPLIPALRAALACALVWANPAPGLAADGVPDPDAARALLAVTELRQRVDPSAVPAADSWRTLSYRGRPAVEVKGRAGGAPGTLRDLAVYDLGTGRVVSFFWFPHASARKAGEPIIPLSEASSRAEAHLRVLLPGADLALDGVQRYRASGQESVYYEAGFTDPAARIPFLAPPVRLLLDASTGNFFRLDVDPEWYMPPRAPAARLSGKAAERIAAAALSSRNLAPLLGAGAALGKVAAAELYIVRPNEWLGEPPPEVGGASVAWVVPFTLAADPARRLHRVFVDAATGRLLGGLP